MLCVREFDVGMAVSCPDPTLYAHARERKKTRVRRGWDLGTRLGRLSISLVPGLSSAREH